MMGKSYPPSVSHTSDEKRIVLRPGTTNNVVGDAEADLSPPPSLLDPLLDGLDASSRRYLFHCTSPVVISEPELISF
jgi:hypothetical protein